MRTININDAEAIRSAFNRDGLSGAIIEIQRRWPGIAEERTADVLEISMDMTAVTHNRSGQQNHSGKTMIVRDITTGRRSPRW